MKKITVIASAVLAVLSLGLAGCKKAPAKADNSLEELKGRGVFVLGLDDSFPPLGFRDEDNNITGYDIVFHGICPACKAQRDTAKA